jgi:hypothetical protein
MMIATRRLCTFGALLLSLAAVPRSASAQAVIAPSPFEVFLSHFDLGVSGSGEFTNNTSAPNYLKQQVALSPSTTVGVLVELRYTVSPRIGVQFNYDNVRYTDNYTITNTTSSSLGALPLVLGVQTKATEYSLGYFGHFGHFGVLRPFVGGGGGVLGFRPTSGGGDGLPGLSRGAAYYNVGADITLVEASNADTGARFADRIGARVQFRQVFFGAPDFNTNYLANGARSSTIEPSVGFYLRF